MSPVQRRLREASVTSLTRPLAPPPFSALHEAFRPQVGPTTPDGDLRKAFYLAYDESACESVVLDQARERVKSGGALVSATFVTPYPPGFPLLVPDQVVDEPTLAYKEALDTPEIHGYRPKEGLRVFREEALRAVPPALAETAASTSKPGAAPLAGSGARRASTDQPDDTTGGEIS